MGTLASELAPHAHRLSPKPRVYADANIPAQLVAHMRQVLGWDVLFVLEDPTLRRASDVAHFKLAAQLARTLLTLDRDYLDDRRFPPREGSGVLVLRAPNGQQLAALTSRVDRVLFASRSPEPVLLPLVGTKLEVHTDWKRDAQ